ncbi:uncharacterized protein LOC125179205 [Hyalella azteca]|uniref:Uncharacterized protein LOC125179205 n=1 Tax=Hyalella azteca TaxID=294128 RepID=A0A979FW02_HYAAZ|nr:uncharacterized protein LOC125179205 [Hyalella azteca]
MAKSTLAFLCIAVVIAETVLQVAGSPLVIADEAEAPALSADELSELQSVLDKEPQLQALEDGIGHVLRVRRADDGHVLGVQETIPFPAKGMCIILFGKQFCTSG